MRGEHQREMGEVKRGGTKGHDKEMEGERRAMWRQGRKGGVSLIC